MALLELMPHLTKRRARKAHGTKKSKKQMGGQKRTWREYFRLPPATPRNKRVPLKLGLPPGVGFFRRPYTLKNLNTNRASEELRRMLAEKDGEDLENVGAQLKMEAREKHRARSNNERAEALERLKTYGNVNLNTMMAPPNYSKYK